MAVLKKVQSAYRGSKEFHDALSERLKNTIRRQAGNEWDGCYSEAEQYRADHLKDWKALAELMRAAPDAGFPIDVTLLPRASNKAVLSHLEANEMHAKAAHPRAVVSKAISMALSL